MLQRFLSMLATLAILIIIGSVFSLPSNVQAATHRQENATIPQIGSKCPDVPDVSPTGNDGTLKDPILDFCSPKAHGNVAGPYGARIVLATENIPADKPLLWLLVNSEQTINDPEKLTECLKQQHCFLIGTPQKLSPEGKKTVYAFTWTGQTFPEKPGDYYIEVTSSKGASTPDQFIAATPVAYTLLSTQAPCITLSIGDNSQTTCNGISQNVSMPLSNTTPIHLNIQGSYWLLGWNPQNIDSNNKVRITAKCTTPKQCSKEILFDITSEIQSDGTFHVTQDLPNSVYGTFTISAINKLPNAIDPNKSDYVSSSSNNSVADGSLEIAPLRFSLQRAPQPSSPNFSSYAIAGAIPAVLSLVFFFILLLFTRYQLANRSNPASTTLQTNSTPASNSYPPLKDPLQRQFSPQNNKTEPISIDFLLRELPFLPFPLRENPQTPIPQKSHLPRLQRNIAQTIDRVTRQWQQKASITTAEKTLGHLLYYDVGSSKKLLKLLTSAPQTPLTPQRIQIFNIRIGEILQTAWRDQTSRQRLCSEALIYCAALLSTSSDVLYHTTLHYSMGYAYALLAPNSPPTTIALLEEAERNYKTALDTVAKNTSNDLLRRFSIILQVAIGDINAAKALVPPTNHNLMLNCYGVAITHYQLALTNTKDETWKDEIRSHWQQVDKQRTLNRERAQ